MRMAMMLAAVLALPVGAGAGEGLPTGLFEITARLELPHLERWAVERTRTVCLGERARLPVPILSPGTGLGRCAAADVRREGSAFSYRIVCPGRDAARASASYRVGAEGFRGRVAIVLGAKNMTMTEVQAGRRLGDCAQSAAR